MGNRNEVVGESIEINDLDLDGLEKQLIDELGDEFAELDIIKEEGNHIADPDHLGKQVLGVIWDQFIGQIAITAGDDFIKENNGLNLDLSEEAHFQTAENFAEGKIATHNTEIDYQERYDKWNANFQTDSEGNIIYKEDQITKESQQVLKKGARDKFDADRPEGSKSVHKDHQISAGEMMRDAALNAHVDESKQIEFANSDSNLHDLDARANGSKRDHNGEAWLKRVRPKGSQGEGLTNAEYFGIDEKEFMEKEAEAREEYVKLIEEGERKSIEAGKESRKKEFFRIGGKALRTAIISLVSELAKRIVGHLIRWFKSSKKSAKTLADQIVGAFRDFFHNLHKSILNIGENILLTVFEAIGGTIARTIRRIITFLKQGWSSIKDAYAYLKNPENKKKSIGLISLEMGKIIITGLTGAGVLLLGEAIEKLLLVYGGNAFKFEIPILGSLGSLLGIFVGGVISGIAGAVALHFMNKLIANKLRDINQSQIIKSKSKIIDTQEKLIEVNKGQLINRKQEKVSIMSNRHNEAAEFVDEALQEIFNSTEDVNFLDDFDSMISELDGLVEE